MPGGAGGEAGEHAYAEGGELQRVRAAPEEPGVEVP